MSALRRRALMAAPLLGAALACGGLAGPPERPQEPLPKGPPAHAPPNLLILVADDVGTDKISAYREHPDPPSTPHIDALAEEGILFENAYAYASCSPSRAALLTGRYARRYGVGVIVQAVESTWELPLDEVTLPEVLGASWDRVALGKWHLSGYHTPSALRHPLLQGFEHHAGSLENLVVGDGRIALRRNGYHHWEKLVDGEPSWIRTYTTRDTTDDAIAWLDELQPPWLLWVAYNAAHLPFHVPPGANLPEGAPDPQKFDAAVEFLDGEIGRLLEAVPVEQRDRTVVVFLGDNGTERGAITAPRDPTHGKGTLREGGTNVPLIVAGSAVKQPGTRTSALVHAVDLLPTLAELTGADVSGLTLDGVSFREVLQEPSHPGRRRYVYTERFAPLGGGPYDIDWRAVRDDRYKVLRSGGQVLMFDLQGRHDDGPVLDPKRLSPSERGRFRALVDEMDRLSSLPFDHG